ncbi:hypothetical protein B0H11DRAFT_1929717 [Mycena galericulata]|nr:hypothetical protein B0H11DRAFT_1932528 [Mycena galericulata]KAJ7447347.1 hypothetical protein B0H11DRAFT_1929717 [Mycena galericulata]
MYLGHGRLAGRSGELQATGEAKQGLWMAGFVNFFHGHPEGLERCLNFAVNSKSTIRGVAREFGVNGTIGLAMHICFALCTNFHLPPSTGQIRLVLLAHPRMSEAKVYAVVGGSNSGVYNRSPHLSAASGSPILPIVIKCNTHGEAKKAAGLHAVLEHLRSETAQDNPQDFAKAIANSNQILPLFPSGGPFYAVDSGKNERAIYLNLFVPQ